MSDKEPPRLETLIKIMQMTTATEDSMSLVAIRKANKFLRESGWDWERLLRGKVRVVGDPFASIPTPPPPRPAAAPYTPPPYTPPPRRQPRPASPVNTSQKGVMHNQFAGHCHCCGVFVAPSAGYIFKPARKWLIACTTCNFNSRPAPTTAAPRQKPATSDVLDIF